MLPGSEFDELNCLLNQQRFGEIIIIYKMYYLSIKLLTISWYYVPMGDISYSKEKHCFGRGVSHCHASGLSVACQISSSNFIIEKGVDECWSYLACPFAFPPLVK